MKPMFLAVAPAILLFAACGGDSKDDEQQQAGGDAAASGTPDFAANDAAVEQPRAPDKPLPTPTRVAPDDVALTVVAGSEKFEPKLSELSSLPQTTIEANGKQYEGVSLAELASRVSAKPEATVTVQGRRGDNLRLGAIRFPVSQIGTDSVLFVDERGHLYLASKSVPVDQWLTVVNGVSFN